MSTVGRAVPGAGGSWVGDGVSEKVEVQVWESVWERDCVAVKLCSRVGVGRWRPEAN